MPIVTPPRAALVIVTAAAVALVVPWPSATVEAVFATTLYPVWQRAATTATNAVPFAVFDAVLIGAVAAVVGGVIRGWRRAAGGRVRRLAASLLAALATAAAFYLWFLVSWGFNYQRLPVAARLGIDRGRATPARLAAFADDTLAELNRLHPLAHQHAWAEMAEMPARLGPAFAAALPLVRASNGVVPGRPKWSLLQPYLRWGGIDGVTNPFAPEVVLNHDLLPVERPFTVAHEWGHLAGLAHEAEASYLGWLTCLAGGDQAQYSARLWAFAHIFTALPEEHRLALSNRLEDGPRRDLRAIAARSAQSVRIVRLVSWTAYDRYLKSNRVSEGLASYDAAIVLILATLPEDRHLGAVTEPVSATDVDSRSAKALPQN
jgi:hypothetical protein